MARLFTFKVPLTIKGRKFKGLRGWAGKPFHPPLTDLPVACYFIVMILDFVSYVSYQRDSASVAHDFFVSGTHVIIVGAISSVGAITTGIVDWWTSTERHTQAWRTANAHMLIMGTMSVFVLVNIILRLSDWDRGYASFPLLVLSVIVGALVSIGATYGGSLVYDYGFNVETAGDHPVWHVSERDVLPGQKELPASDGEPNV